MLYFGCIFRTLTSQTYLHAIELFIVVLMRQVKGSFFWNVAFLIVLGVCCQFAAYLRWVILSAGLAKDGCRQEAVEIVYTSVKVACQAVASLHRHNVGGGGAIWARQLGGEVLLDMLQLLMLSLLCSSCTVVYLVLLQVVT